MYISLYEAQFDSLFESVAESYYEASIFFNTMI